jgi:hypothetical protein
VKLASSVWIQMADNTLRIDGIEFPFYVSEDITVEPGGWERLTVINLPLVLDLAGVVVITSRDGERQVIDGQNGDVADWARRLVREGLLEALPWLDIGEAQ